MEERTHSASQHLRNEPGSVSGNAAHWIFLAGIFILCAVAALVWSTRGLGRPNPFDLRSSTLAIGTKSAVERDAAILRFSLFCMDSFHKKQFEVAIGQCDLILDLDPGNFNALSLRGSALMMAGKSGRALADFSALIRLFPASPSAYRYRASIYATQNNNTMALADYNRAVALAPNDPLNREYRGHFYQMTGDYRSAIADFSIVIARQPMLARAWNSRCWSRLLANANLDQALADCGRSLQLDPTSPNAFDSHGYVLYRLNRLAAAIASFDKAVKLNPKLSSAWFGRGLCKLRLHDLSASQDIARARQLEPGIEARFARYGIRPRASGPSGA